MSNWISWSELINLGEKPLDVFEYLKKGLQPYSKLGDPIYCPYINHRYNYLHEKQYSSLNRLVIESNRWIHYSILFRQFSYVKEGTKLNFRRVDYGFFRKGIEEYNREVTKDDQIQIQDYIYIDLQEQFENLIKFKECLKKKINETIKDMEDIIDDDPNLDENQKKLSWKYFVTPGSKEEYSKIVLKLENALFKKDNVNRFVKKKEVAKTIKIEKTAEQDKTMVFPCNPKTKWDQIEMALLPSGDKFMVKTPLGHGYYDHVEIGLFKDSTKSKKPNTLWVFLSQLAKMDGFFPLNGVQDFEKLSSDAKRLNKHFKKPFGLKESIYKGRCNKIGGYKTKFKISLIPDDNDMINRRSLIDEELENSKYSSIKEASYYPEHSTFKKE